MEQPCSASRTCKWVTILAVVTLIFAALVAYHNSFSAPFFFDDEPAIIDNPTIRQLWPLASVLSPPSGAGVTNRPIVNLSLALNYAFGGLHVEGYHVFNLAIHLLAALALYGIVQCTLQQRNLHERYGAVAQPLAWLASLLWLVHPLQTESVTCVIQRTESLMGLFYLAGLYAAIRAMNSARPFGWMSLAVGCTLVGMGTKEVMVTAPLMFFLYDRTFVAGSFRAAWQQRKGFYLSLALTWGLLGWLVVGMGWGTRGGTCGFNGAITWWEYLMTQFYAIVRYLRLSLWPHPLVVDYGRYLVTSSSVIVPCGLMVLGLGVATLVALWRWRVWGFLGVWFFGILAPSSSVLPLITQTMAEHRMYLPLAAVVVLGVLGLHHALKGWALPVGVVIALGLIVVTSARNHDYRSALAIWQDTVTKWPDQARAQATLGGLLASDPKRCPEAIGHLEYALLLAPEYATAYNNLGMAMTNGAGRNREAVAAFEKALALQPDLALAHANLGAVLSKLPGRQAEARAHLQKALDLKPELAVAHATLGALLLADKKSPAEAITHLQAAIRLDPEDAEAHANLGNAYANDPARLEEALGQLKTATRLRPDLPQAWNSLAVTLAQRPGQQAEAISAYETALKLRSDYWEAQYNLGMLLLDQPGRLTEAITHLESAARLTPENPSIRTNLGFALATIPDRLLDAARQFESVVRLQPDSPDAHFNFGMALFRLPGRETEAIEQFQTTLRLNPNDADAHNNLGLVLAGLPERVQEAQEHFEASLRLKPEVAETHFNLARLLAAMPGRLPEAIRQLETTLRLAPQHEQARTLLAQLRTRP